MVEFLDKILGLRPGRKTDYLVVVTDGERVKAFPVVEIIAYNGGRVMRYKNSAKKLDMVYVGPRYRAIQEGDKWLVGKRVGNNSACHINYQDQAVDLATGVIGPSTDPDCPGEDLSALIRTDGLATAYKSLYESKFPLKLIIIAGIAIVVIIGIVYFIQSRGA